MPKLYFFDTGLACSLLNIASPADLQDHYLRGGLFESFVISEFLKLRFNAGLPPNLFYWRDKTGHEIDLIFEEHGRPIPIEIKSGQTAVGDYFDGLKYFGALAGVLPKDLYVIYAGEEKQSRSQGNLMPWHEISEMFGVAGNVVVQDIKKGE
jgi:predicted AAA+ superfamily ATPase